MKIEPRAWSVLLLGLLISIAGVATKWPIRHEENAGIDPMLQERGHAPASYVSTIIPLARDKTATEADPSRRISSPVRDDAGGSVDVRAHSGWAFIKSGEYARAARLLTEAARRFPDDSSVQLGLGVSYFHLEHDQLAIAALNRALALNPDMDQAHALLGELYFKHDDLEASVQHYETAARRDPSDTAVQDGLFTARRAYRAEAGLQRLYSAHFVVKYEAAHRRIANAILDRLEEQHRVIGRRLGWNGKEPMIVILYSTRRFEERTGSPDWAVGLYDGKIHFVAERVMSKGRPNAAMLAHEYTHAVVHRLSGGHAPTWLQEGLALYFERRPIAWSRHVLARHREDITPLHALHGSFLALAPREAELAYAEGYSATTAIIDQYGFVKVEQLLAVLATMPVFSAAFETVFHQSYRDFETAWVFGLTGRRT